MVHSVNASVLTMIAGVINATFHSSRGQRASRWNSSHLWKRWNDISSNIKMSTALFPTKPVQSGEIPKKIQK